MPCLFCVFFERKKSHTKHTHSWKLIWPKRFKVCFDWRRHHQVFPTFFGHGILKGNELASIIMHKRPWKTSSFPMKLRQSLWKWMLNIFSCSLKLCKSAASCVLFINNIYSHTTATSDWDQTGNHIQTTPRITSFWQGVICDVWPSQFQGWIFCHRLWNFSLIILVIFKFFLIKLPWKPLF